MSFLKGIFTRARRDDYESVVGQPSADFSNIAFIICTFVLLQQFYPIDSFLTSYLVSPPMKFTVEQLNEKIYPFGLFCSFVLVIVVFLITDYVRYKPIIILNGISGILTYGLLLGRPTMTTLYLEQFCFGFFYASNVASSTYLYAKVADVSRYQKIAALVQTCLLFGQFFRGVFSQLILSFTSLRMDSLPCFSTGGLILATLWSFFIPSVKHSIYFHHLEKVESGGTNPNEGVTIIKSQKFSAVAQRIAYDFKISYTNTYVLKWSLWWGLSRGVYHLILTYSQVLWQIVVKENGGCNDQLMNGAVDSIFTLTSACASYYIGMVKFDWKSNSDLILCVVSFIFAVLTQFMYWSSSLFLIYFMYIVLGCIFQTVLTIAQSEVAQHIEKDSYALIFGFNLFLSLATSSILTFMFIQGWIILLSVRLQFLCYAVCFGIIAFFFFIRLVWTCRRNSM